MNICVISGQLEGNAIVRGKNTKAMAFTIITKQPSNANGNAEGEQDPVCYVPAVIFNPPENLEKLLTTQGKGLWVELQGRVHASRHEPGESRSNADVVVFTKSLVTHRGT